MPNTEEWLKTLTPEMRKDFKEMDKRGMYETILDLGYRCDKLESNINEKDETINGYRWIFSIIKEVLRT